MQLLLLKNKEWVFESGCHLVDDSVQFQQCDKNTGFFDAEVMI